MKQSVLIEVHRPVGRRGAYAPLGDKKDHLIGL